MLSPQKILFVCTGNICRSPLAEAVARHKAKARKKENLFIFDSAGTDSYHEGEKADIRSIEVGKKNGISFDNIFSRPINANDFEEFDLILAMDRGHVSRLLARSHKKHHHKIKLFLDYLPAPNKFDDEVIDPYYGANKGFEEMYEVIDSALELLFND